MPPRMRAGVALVLGALAAAFAWWQLTRPVELADAPVTVLPCLSYAPYRDGQTPFDEAFVTPRWQIEEDLRLLAVHTACVRTYSVDQGLDAVPEIAAGLGLRVMLGAWVGREAAKNEKELARAIALANRYPETVAAVIVGNEVLLRREQPPDRLAAMIETVRAQVPVAVTYADVWEFWLQHPEIADHVDFVTVHMLPYWEDEPIAVARAVAHVLAIWQRVAETFPGKPIIIGEAGWPSAGRMREGARPGRVEQAKFVRQLLAATAARGIPLNLIEAFDQPWKRRMEGTVGGHWGLFSEDRTAKFALKGPVAPLPDWPRLAAASLALALVLTVAVAWAAPSLAFAGWLALAIGAQVAAAAIVVAAGEAIDSSLTAVDWAAAAGRIGLALAAFVTVAAALVRPAAARVMSSELLAALACRRWPRASSRLALGLAAMRLLALLATAATTIALLFDPRYRDFPVAATLVPAAAVLLLALVRPAGRRGEREDGLLAVALAIGGLGIIASEGVANLQAVAWAALCLTLALAVALDRRSAQPRSATAGSRSPRSRAASTASEAAPAP